MTLRSLAVLAVLPLAACGGTEGPDLGLDPRAEQLDQQQYEQLRAAVDRVADDAFAAAGTAVAGTVRAYQLVTVRCAGEPRAVGSLTVVGEVTYDEPDDTVTDRAIGAAWRDLGLAPRAISSKRQRTKKKPRKRCFRGFSNLARQEFGAEDQNNSPESEGFFAKAKAVTVVGVQMNT